MSSSAEPRAAGVTVGVIGGRWRGTVTPWGALVPADGSAPLEWWVAAEDRWHTPAEEPSCRQRLIEGVPVVETAIRVPGGDAVQRTYAVADDGGLTVVEVENRSPASFAVALSRRDLLTSRPPAGVPVLGVEAPADALVLPIGHRTTVRVALAHDGRGAGVLPPDLPAAEQVARGWLIQIARGVDLRLPSTAPEVPVPTRRSALLLDGPGDPSVDGASYLVAVAELARLGAGVEEWLDGAVVAAERVARRSRRATVLPWADDAGLVAAQELFAGAGDPRAARDVAALRRRLPRPEPTPLEVPDGALGLAWGQRRVAVGGSDGVDLVPAPFPAAWGGQPFEAYGVPAGGATVGLAVRWHGERPALLWEVDGPAAALSCSGLDPTWSSAAQRGEALLAPARAMVPRDLQ